MLACALGWLGASGCGGDQAAPAQLALEDLNVVVIVIDTFGAEQAGAFMNPGLAHTPHMDKLAASGAVFRHAYAPSPWTQPSVASLMTGVMPSTHGCKSLDDHIWPKQPTLAEGLEARGFATGGVISHRLVRGRGYNRGFQSYDDSAVGDHATISSQQVTDKGIEWIDKALADNAEHPRFFLFAHYFDPHYEYRHHEAYDQTSGYDGELEPGMGIWPLRERRDKMSRADLDYLIGLHREEIQFTDEHIGRLLAHIEAKGLGERTLVILTADHGEEFMRHGWLGHTRTLYDELLHVPMIVALPGTIAPAVVDEPVSLIDVMPTVLGLSRTPPERPSWTGVSLWPRLAGSGGLDDDRSVFGEVSFSIAPQLVAKVGEKIAFKTSVLRAEHKLVHDLLGKTWELYNLADDPEELNNLIGTDHAAEAALRPELLQWEASRNPRVGKKKRRSPAGMDPAEIARLRALGYIK